MQKEYKKCAYRSQFLDYNSSIAIFLEKLISTSGMLLPSI